jgi:hypothetical protein
MSGEYIDKEFSMKNTKILLAILAIALVFGMTACSNGGGGTPQDNPQGMKGIKYSIQVNNQAASRAINATDKVELYILNFEYLEDANTRGLMIIANGNRTDGMVGDEEVVLNNAGWYSVTADLAVLNKSGVNYGKYSCFAMVIDKLRVEGKEYVFPYSNDGGVLFGNISSVWAKNGRKEYPGNFNGINITDSTASLKTVLTVEPAILGTPNSSGYDANGFATDPYKYIKVEGIVSE